MSVKIGINGFGRIGRNIFRALHERKDLSDIDIVAINDLGDASTNAHLLKYDTAHGKFNMSVEFDEKNLIVDGKNIHAFSERILKIFHGKTLALILYLNALVFLHPSHYVQNTLKAEQKGHTSALEKAMLMQPLFLESIIKRLILLIR